MSGRVLWIAAIGLLAATTLLTFVFPEPMISPGALLDGHGALAQDCFACHTPFLGTGSDKCADCHAPERIGKFTTKGEPIAGTRVSFHQNLIEQNCRVCHAEHRGSDGARSMKAFSHALLKPAVRDDCASCHAKPDDSLHRRIDTGCQECHDTKAWTPATFEHAKYFVLDRDHDTNCATCHADGNFDRYSCYGCHEHTPGGIRAEHVEEGIRDFENCVKCHRSADEPEERGERETRENEDD